VKSRLWSYLDDHQVTAVDVIVTVKLCVVAFTLLGYHDCVCC